MGKRKKRSKFTNFVNLIAELVKNDRIADDDLNRLFYISLFDPSSLEDEYLINIVDLENMIRSTVEDILFNKLECFREKYDTYQHNIDAFMKRYVYSDVLTRGILIGFFEKNGIHVDKKLSTGDTFRDIVIKLKDRSLFVEIKRYTSGSNAVKNIRELIESIGSNRSTFPSNGKLLLLVFIPEIPLPRNVTNAVTKFFGSERIYRKFLLRRLNGISSGFYLFEDVARTQIKLSAHDVKVLVQVISGDKDLDERFTLSGLVSRIKNITREDREQKQKANV